MKATARKPCCCLGYETDSLSADKAYDTDAILEHLAATGIEAVIPPRSHRLVQRPFDRHLYKNRNLVERFFCRQPLLRQTRRTFRSPDRPSRLSTDSLLQSGRP
ncbi:MAG: transposase [Dechloromonas sp.]|nr:MAG: transposase [Dechloromonas sp.]